MRLGALARTIILEVIRMVLLGVGAEVAGTLLFGWAMQIRQTSHLQDGWHLLVEVAVVAANLICFPMALQEVMPV
jgi:hypothetical protein